MASPFTVAASASDCSGQPVTSIGYSIDDSTNTAVVSGASVKTQASSASGTHTLHVKSWGNAGSSCDSDVTVDVTTSNSPVKSLVPSNATVVSNLQNQGGWQLSHDPATGASSSGAMSVVGSPSITGHARRFDTRFSGSGGEIYNISWGNDTTSKNFFYDGWVYLTNSASNMMNLEMDMNQVMDNGETVIYGFQCDGYSNTWDYTKNTGSPDHWNDAWIHSGAYCNVSQWSKNTWHHIQISYSRDDSGDVTYNSVWLDGVQSQIDVTVPSSFALGWNPVLLTNFQVDGNGSGSNTVYLDNLTISRW